ncbi:MAG: carboxypeptidase regulatory-like domain-containing protein, partial [Propionibacteriaceae bacterium]|nr:carboxypeptidase regulatory-like domain-containing protein [Propionibacteriaceae bacterium]
MWFDDNKDGQQTPGEKPLPRAVVKLLDADGHELKSTVTNVDGYYWFDLLPAGDYQIEFSLPNGYLWTTAFTGDARTDSNASQVTGRSEVFTLSESASYVVPADDASVPANYKSQIRAQFINPTIDAGVILPQSGLKLTKWVCAIGIDCSDPTGADLVTLAGYSSATGVTQGRPAGGWVKETTVDYNTGAEWLIVVTNTGQAALSGVTVDDAYVNSLGAGALSCSDLTPGRLLLPGESTLFHCFTEYVTNTAAYVVGDNGQTNNVWGEPVYNEGEDVVNGANAEGVLVVVNPDGSTTPITDADGNEIKLISNSSTAEVNTVAPEPEIKLTKWVCDEGTGCTVPRDLRTLSGVSTDSGLLRVQAGAPDSGWVKETTVPYGTSAQWLLVVSNIGDTILKDVHISSDITIDYMLPLTMRTETLVITPFVTPVPWLYPGESIAFIAMTPVVTNTNPFAVGFSAAADPVSAEPVYNIGEDVVNFATAMGTPIDEDGNDIPRPNGADGPYPPRESNESTAEVNSIAFAVGDYVWIDANLNGQQDLGEVPIKDVTVRLLDDQGDPVISPSATELVTVTDANGYYWFDLLPAGEYHVEFELPPGYMWTKAVTGPVATDSDANFTVSDQDVARSAVFTLGLGADNLVESSDASVPAAYRAQIRAPYINPTIDAGVVPINPALDLAKWVCAKGTGCVKPGDPGFVMADLSLPPAGWVKATTVPLRTSAEWLVIVQNTGNVPMADVVLIREDLDAGGLGFINRDCQLSGVSDLLLPGEYAFYMCTVDKVTNTAAHGSKKDIINTAQAEGNPVNEQNRPIRKPGGDEWGPVQTDEDFAEVNTTPPKVETGGTSLPASSA